MLIHDPCIITPRLMAGVAIGGGWVSLGAGPRNADGRTVYGCFIDLPDGTAHEVTDLRSGCGGGDTQEGIASLLSFLAAAAESYGFEQRTGIKGECADLFPPAVVQWAHENADDISALAYELEERAGIIED